MSFPYVLFPGASGHYVSRADVNLLDADTAHGIQSIGKWANGNGTFLYEVEADVAAFGGSAIRWQCNASGFDRLARFSPEGTGGIPVSPNTLYAVTCRFKTSAVITSAALQVRQYNAGGSAVAAYSTLQTVASPTVGQWVELSGTFTTAATAAFLASQINVNSTAYPLPGTSFSMYADQACIRAGSTSTFVPSLRIVGNLDMRARAAAIDWTAAANQTLLHKAAANNGYALQITTGGELLGWHGDGTDYNPGTSTGAALTNGSAYELRATLVEATGVWTYYKDNVVFDTDTLGALTAVPDTTTNLLVAAATSATLLFNGDIYWAEVRDGIGGPVVARFDAADIAAVLP